jgi:hypothetical protein
MHNVIKAQEEIDVWLYIFLTSTIDVSGWSASWSGPFTSEEKVLVPLDRWLCGLQSWSVHCAEEKTLMSPLFITEVRPFFY